MNSKVIWFLGLSCSGKKTIIRELSSIEPTQHVEEIREYLGIIAYEIIPSEKSLSRPGNRSGLCDEIVSLLGQGDDRAILAKVQYEDLDNHLIDSTMSLTPEASHTLVYLDCEIEELKKRSAMRMKKRPGWPGIPLEEIPSAEKRLQLIPEHLARSVEVKRIISTTKPFRPHS